MTFEQALTAMRNGKTTRIKTNLGITNRYRLFAGLRNRMTCLTEECGKRAMYCNINSIGIEEILSDKWEVLENKNEPKNL